MGVLVLVAVPFPFEAIPGVEGVGDGKVTVRLLCSATCFVRLRSSVTWAKTRLEYTELSNIC